MSAPGSFDDDAPDCVCGFEDRVEEVATAHAGRALEMANTHVAGEVAEALDVDASVV